MANGHVTPSENEGASDAIRDTIYLSKKIHSVEGPRPNSDFRPYSGQSSNNTNSMHQAIMTGPTLSPQGGIDRSQGVNGHVNRPPPGLASPMRSSPYSNGYLNHSALSTQAPALNNRPANGDVQLSMASAGSITQTSLSPYQPSPSQQTTPSRSQQPHYHPDPFHNSFERQRPSSSHSVNSAGGFPSPIKNHPCTTPKQSSSEVGPLGFPPGVPTPQSNGLHPYRSIGATHPSFYSLPKVPPSSPPPPYASSPVMAPPGVDPVGSNSGLSPEKHSPPRPASSHSITTAPVLSPIPQLSPTPYVQNLHVPVKSMTAEQKRTVSGQVNGQ
jgi:hypothetical protein